jgi:hypothetical protein
MIENTSPEGRSRRARRAAGDAPVARAARRRDVTPAPARAPRTLSAAREAFVAAIARDTPGADRPRLVKVLDALIAWSVARRTALAFRTDEKRADVLAFALVGTGDVFWSAFAARDATPTLEIHLPAGRPNGAEDRAMVMQTLNAHSRVALVEGDRLRIGFGALKNEAARAAVLALMRQLLMQETDSGEPRSG